jgi:hypothetical protein
MTTGGWIFMIASWAVIISVGTYCYCRSLGSPDNEERPYPTAEDLD